MRLKVRNYDFVTKCTARPRTPVRCYIYAFAIHNGSATSFFRIPIHSKFFCVDRSHVGIYKATCHCGIVYLYSPKLIVFVGLCRTMSVVKIQRCEAPQRAILLVELYRMWSLSELRFYYFYLYFLAIFNLSLRPT